MAAAHSSRANCHLTAAACTGDSLLLFLVVFLSRIAMQAVAVQAGDRHPTWRTGPGHLLRGQKGSSPRGVHVLCGPGSHYQTRGSGLSSQIH